MAYTVILNGTLIDGNGGPPLPDAAVLVKDNHIQAAGRKSDITFAGVMPHGTNLRELGLMCNVGMSPMDALVATTRVAAECLGWQDRVGTIEAGKLADLIITRSDPIADIRSLENVDNVALVMKDGRVVKDAGRDPK